jgi:hypothetical protein
MSPFRYLSLLESGLILDEDLKNGNSRLDLHDLELHLAGDTLLVRDNRHGQFWFGLKNRREEELNIQKGVY